MQLRRGSLAYRVASLGLIFWVVGGTAYAALQLTFGPRPADVHVRWATVDDSTRTQLEQRYGLSQPQLQEGRTWSYALLDLSRENIRALVGDPAVEDTHYIHRTEFRVGYFTPRLPYPTSYEWLPRGLEILTYFCLFAGFVCFGVAIVARAKPGIVLAVATAVRMPASAASAGFVAGFRALVHSVQVIPVPRSGPAAVLAVVSVAAVRLVGGWDSPIGAAYVWIPWLEAHAWDWLPRLSAAVFLAAGALVTLRVAARQSGTPSLALVTILLTVYMFPAGGSAAGFLLFALVVWACDRYIDARGRQELWVLTLLTAVVGAFRLEYVLYVGAGVIAALFVRHVRDSARAFATATAEYAGGLAVIALLFVPLGHVPTALGGLVHNTADIVAGRTAIFAAFAAAEDSGHAVKIRWTPGVEAAQRQAKERQYELRAGVADRDDASGRTWQYRWDLSSFRIRQMLGDPAIEDTQGIGRPATNPGAIGLLVAEAFALAFDVWTRSVPWLWVVLPGAVVLRLSRGALRWRNANPPPAPDMTLLPASVLCAPVGWLVVQGAADIGAGAAPVMSALAIVAVSLLAALVRPTRSGMSAYAQH